MLKRSYQNIHTERTVINSDNRIFPFLHELKKNVKTEIIGIGKILQLNIEILEKYEKTLNCDF